MTNDDLKELVGNNLRRYRLENGLTQEKTAEKAGISVSFYANLEGGKKSMSIFVLRNLADSLGISADYLLHEDCSNSRLHNIEMLLSNQPKELIISIEKLIRLCIVEFASTNLE